MEQEMIRWLKFQWIAFRYWLEFDARSLCLV